MFKKIMLRSVSGATAVGAALAMTLSTTPAVVTTAPEIRNVACEVKYPGSVATTTQLSLARPLGVYGDANFATARVSRDEAGAKTPDGPVRFLLTNPDGSLRRIWFVQLQDGEATVRLPRRLDAQTTYRMRASYRPDDCSVFERSSSAPRYYTVEQAATRTFVGAPNVTRAERPRVRVAVGSESRFTADGRVRIVLKRDGRVLARKDRFLNDDGRAFTRFGKVRPGRYRVVVRYFGNQNFERSRGVSGFRVTRR